MEVKKILIIYAKNPEEILNRKSAMGSYIYSLAQLLTKDKIDIHINGSPFKELLPLNNLSENSSRGGFLASLKKLIPVKIRHALSIKRLFSQIDVLTQKLLSKDSEYDVVLEFYTLGSNVGLEFCRAKKIPLAIVYDAPIIEEYTFFHGHEPYQMTKIQNREKKTIEYASSIVVYSKPMKSYLQTNYPESKPTYFIHQNIDFSRFRFKESNNHETDTLNLCFVGSFLKWHRTDILIQSFVKLEKEFPGLNARLYLIGDGMERVTSQNLASELGSKNIIFTGFLDGEELFKMQTIMHVGIMPGSNWYGAPNKIFEYGAMNMDCIAPKTPTISDIFDTSLVYFFENQNADSFYSALSEVVQNSALRAKLQKSLHHYISSEFGPEKTSNFYKEVLSIQY